jgi:hypothetical protein
MATPTKRRRSGIEANSTPPPVGMEKDARARATRAHRDATKAFREVVESLVGHVGAPLVAYIGGVGETRAVRQWITGERQPASETKSKLQIALLLAELLNQAGQRDAIEPWFLGMNPSLDDHAPAELLRDAQGVKITSTGRRVLAAAREFADG